MSEAELQLLKEGLELADDALARLMDINNEHIKHIANMLHSALWFGELILNAKDEA